MSHLVVTSGGMDSTTLLHHVSRDYPDVKALTFQYGQTHSKEIGFARQNCADLGIPLTEIDLRDIFKHISTSALTNPSITIPTIKEVQGHPQPVTYVPARNLLFLSIAASVAESLGCDKIWYGIQRHDLYAYWDTSAEFVKNVQSVIDLNRLHHITIETPFVDMSKAEILKLGRHLDVDYSKTWSCYAGRDLACGVCPTCAERLKAFKQVGLVDPLQYEGKS